MRFNSIYQYFLVGLIVTALLLIQGYYVVFGTMAGFIFVKAFYVVLSAFVLFWCFYKYRYHKNRFVMLDEDKMIIQIGESRYNIADNQLESIFELTHRSTVKMHNVIHIFTKEGEYIYLTNNIDKFEKLKDNLKERYSDRYYKREKPCTMDLCVTQENLYRLIHGDNKESGTCNTLEKNIQYRPYHI